MQSSSETTNNPPVNLIMAGGTGGHIFPALALARQLEAAGEKVVWLGSISRMEAQLVPQQGIEFHGLKVSALRGKGKLALAKAPINLIVSLWQALTIIKQVKPTRVIGFGGFASGPGGLAAWLKGLPLFIHEQNALAGLTNKLLSKLAKQVFTAFPQAFADNKKTCLVGNPVRQQLTQLASPEIRYRQRGGALRLLVVGGSLGAEVLNTHLPATVKLLLEQQTSAELPLIHHQTGKNQAAKVTAAYTEALADLDLSPEQLAQQVQVSEFIDDMAQALAWADIIICRAGALTVAEVSVAGVAAIFVPYPFAVDDHQTHNARYLSDAQAAILIPQPEFTPSALAEFLLSDAAQRTHLTQLAIKATQLAKVDAAQTLAQKILNY